MIASIENFWNPLRDPNSVKVFYDSLASFNLTNMFGPTHLTDIEGVCNAPDEMYQ